MRQGTLKLKRLVELIDRREVIPRAWKLDDQMTAEAYACLTPHLPEELLARVEVYWNPLLRTSAGQARCHEARIILNPRLMQEAAEETRVTFRHELAHVLTFCRHFPRNVSPHGPEWQKACADLGIAGEDRCHHLDWQRRRQKRRFVYVCHKCGATYPRVRRIARKVACAECCQRYNKGRFSSRFLLQERRLASSEA